jgi:hypothetical protein
VSAATRAQLAAWKREPFFAAVYGGKPVYHVTAADQLHRVQHLDAEQCRAALAKPHLAKTVRAAVERRLKALSKGAK